MKALLALEGGLVFVALVLGAAFGVAPLGTMSFDVVGLVLGLLATLPMLAMLALLARSQARFLREIRARVEQAIGAMLRRASLLEIALLCAAAGIGEEALFRGFLQGGLDAWLGSGPALVLASILFGIAHPVTPEYAAIATLIGAYLGGLWLLSGNLLVPMIAHGLYDFVAMMAMLRRQRIAASQAT